MKISDPMNRPSTIENEVPQGTLLFTISDLYRFFLIQKIRQQKDKMLDGYQMSKCSR